MSNGVIYILTNPSFPELVKIGYADNLEKRLRQLNRSETVPFAFRAYATYDVDHRLTDKQLHNLIDNLNPDLRSVETFNGKKRTKEFFAMSPEEAYGILEAIAKISGTMKRLHRVAPTGVALQEDKEAAEITREARRGRFKFSMVNIPVGATITFLGDETITATVVDDHHIKIGNQTTSLSRSAQDIKGFRTPVQGTIWWKYKGKLLNDIRTEMGL